MGSSFLARSVFNYCACLLFVEWVFYTTLTIMAKAMKKATMKKAAMKTMKKAAMKKAMKKTVMKKAMKKAMKKKTVATGKLAKLLVFRGSRVKTSGGLKKDKLTKNKDGKVVSAAM